MKILIQLLITSVLLSPLQLLAQTPEEQGLSIMQEAKKRNTGFRDTKVEMEMILRNKNGDESRRKMHQRTLEILDDGDKSLSIFDTPRDVKGTAFLSFSHPIDPDDQWLYLPALKRVKRIASNNKSGPFMGSEFAFEDLTSQEVEKYSYKYLRDEQINNINCFVVEAYPAYEYSGYTRAILWIDQNTYNNLKIEYYDRKNSLLKTQLFKNYQLYLDKFWRPDEIFMQNNQNGKSTQLIFSHYQFNNGFTDRDFDKNTLKRAH